jgi:hypothetical protein
VDVAWRLTVGMDDREMTVLDCARRMPPDGTGKDGAGAGELVSAVGAAC